MNGVKYIVFILLFITWSLVSYFFAAGNQKEGNSFATGWMVGTLTFWSLIGIYSMAVIIAGVVQL